MMNEYSITFYDLSSQAEVFNYVVIAASYNGSWVWVRKKGMQEWEMPTGHVEIDEKPEEAARRELWEESGAVEFELYPVCDFSIEHGTRKSHNRLFYAQVTQMGELPNFEMEEVSLRKTLPDKCTYGNVHPVLLDKVMRMLDSLDLKNHY
ncbi:MAG: NUDIX domain-containing protein [Bacteroidales bacterium]